MIKKIINIIGCIILFAAISFVGYGLKTQCPDVADNVYVKCYDY